MAELRALHISDNHGDTNIINLAAAIAKKEKVDVAYFTGDMIGSNNTKEQKPNSLEQKIIEGTNALNQSENTTNLIKFQETNNLKTIEDLEKLSEDKKKQFEQFQQVRKQQSEQVILKPILDAYQTQMKSFQKLKDSTTQKKIAGVLGNHDLTIAYRVFENIIDFADIKNEIKVKGKSRDFTIKGLNNTNEVPALYNDQGIQQTLAPHFINYNEGTPGDNKELTPYQKPTEDRLNNTGDADILLAHKVTEKYGPSGKPFETYKNQVKSAYGGHLHSGEITKIRTESGKIVPTFTTGTNHAFVYDYNKNGEVEKVKIYNIAA